MPLSHSLTWTCCADSSKKKGRQTNKTAGFVCEQTVNCDGASFNPQIHLSTRPQQRIDSADQKNEYLFQGLTSYSQDAAYLVTYSVNIQRQLTQLAQGIYCLIIALLFKVCSLTLPSYEHFLLFLHLAQGEARNAKRNKSLDVLYGSQMGFRSLGLDARCNIADPQH